jgi:hypothetical protein
MSEEGKRVEVYYNVTAKCLSVRQGGKVVKHTHAIKIYSTPSSYGHVDFTVQPAGRKKVVRTKRKGVHAFVRGQADLDKTPSLEEKKLRRPKWLRRVSYNPYKSDKFVDVKTGKPVDYAKEVFIDGNKVFITKEYK